MKYTMLTDDDRKFMLNKIGVQSIDELFADLPADIRIDALEGLPKAVSEMEITQTLQKIGAKNTICSLDHVSQRGGLFCGGGCYDHYVPASVDELAKRSEFYTSYTPYQPEVSQGTLTAIFEYQTYMCRLTGMDVANASLYDGATALAEAVMMSCKEKRRQKVLVSRSVNPLYRQTLATYAWAVGIEIVEIPLLGMCTDVSVAESLCDDSVAALIVQSPNFFGCIEPVEQLALCSAAHTADLIYTVSEALSLALLKSPREQGATIVCGEAQSFGNYLAFGGPLLGFIAATKNYMRKLPGRLVGLSTDEDGLPAFALTLQAREQHIRREKATSNICSNQGLLALRAAIYLGLTGAKLHELAQLNHTSAFYLYKELCAVGCMPVQKNADAIVPFFNEFMVQNGTSGFSSENFGAGIDAGIWYPEFTACTIFCVTEKNTKESIDSFVMGIRAGQ